MCRLAGLRSFSYRKWGAAASTVELLQTGGAESLPWSPAAGRRLSNTCFSSLAVLSLTLEKNRSPAGRLGALDEFQRTVFLTRLQTGYGAPGWLSQ